MRGNEFLEEEVKLIVTLLDAAEATGALSDSQRRQWHETRSQYQTAAPFPQGAKLYRLLDEISSSGTIREFWIQQRWLVLRTRIASRNERRTPS